MSSTFGWKRAIPAEEEFDLTLAVLIAERLHCNTLDLDGRLFNDPDFVHNIFMTHPDAEVRRDAEVMWDAMTQADGVILTAQG